VIGYPRGAEKVAELTIQTFLTSIPEMLYKGVVRFY